MGKVLKAIAIIAVAVAVAYFAPQFLPALIGTGATAAAVTAAVVSIAIGVAISTGLSLLAGKPATASATPSVFRQSLANSFIIYGKRRAGGLLIFYHPRGKDFRYYVIAVAGHRCKGVVRWWLNDEVVTVDGSGMVTSGKYANNAWLWFYRGTSDQAAHPTFVAETEGKWTTDHRGRDTALIYAKFAMSDEVVQAGMPNITAEVEGKDDILDPRTDTRGYTRNASLVFYDWMRLSREEGGFGAYPDEIDEDWVSAQANVCDEVVQTPGGPEARYELDCYIQTGAAPSEVRDTLVTCCAGSFTYSGGKMLMRPGYFVPPSATLHERDLAGPITVPALLAGDQTATEVSGSYIDPTQYQPADVPTRSIDAIDVRQQAFDLPHITSIYRGQRLLEFYLRKSLAERRVSWPMNIMGIAISTLDTVQLATSRYGLSNYAFQTTAWGLNQDFSVSLQLEEHSPDLFEFTLPMYSTPGGGGELATADPIDDRAGRVARQIIASTQTVAYPVTSTSDTITVAVFAANIDDGTRIEFPAATLSGLTPATAYVVLFDTGAQAYIAELPGGAGILNPSNVLVRNYATASADGTYPPTQTPPGGDGGGGYDRFNNLEPMIEV